MARRRRRNFSKVDFRAFPGPMVANKARKWIQRARKHHLVGWERCLRVPGCEMYDSCIFGQKTMEKPAAGEGEFRNAKMWPFRALRGQMMVEIVLGVLKSISWRNFSAI